MKRFNNIHPFNACLLLAFLIVAVCTFLTGCGSIKKTEKTATQVHKTLNVDSVVTTQKATETKFYGDTLTGKSHISTAETDTSGNDKPDSTEAESAGLKIKIKVTPKRNSAGHVTGSTIEYSAVAKPVAQTNSTEVGKLAFTKSAVNDSVATKDETTNKQVGFSIPWWLWLIPVALAVLAAILFYNRLKKLI